MIFQGGDEWRRVALMISKAVAMVIRYEPERYDDVMAATDLSELSKALGVPGDTAFIDTLPYLRHKYEEGAE